MNINGICVVKNRAMKKKTLKKPKRRIPLPAKTEKVHDDKAVYTRRTKYPKKIENGT